ncbi:hypothetical protein APHAL10511_002794 [Amanita phalloides]|nr:hypothetical protein APHAL10511_002794 [Amanita phalloides]
MSSAIIRGRALGNIFNNADVEEPPLPLGQKGVVKLFTSLAQAEGPTKPLILKTKVVPTIAPVLKRLAELSPFIKDDNHHVTLLDGDQWSMMGTYRLAVGENEEIEWSLESGTPSLTLCISATNPLTAVSSGGGGSTAPAPAPESTGLNSAQHSKKELITLLNIPEHLTIDIKGKNIGIREYYSRYRACLEAQSTLSEKIQAGTWVGKRPNNATIIQLFTSKTTWHTYIVPAFSDINNFPVLKQWLEGEDGCPTDIDIWGKEKNTYTFAELKEEKERRSKKPEKGKKKKVDKGEGSSSRGTAERKHKRRNK